MSPGAAIGERACGLIPAACPSRDSRLSPSLMRSPRWGGEAGIWATTGSAMPMAFLVHTMRHWCVRTFRRRSHWPILIGDGS